MKNMKRFYALVTAVACLFVCVAGYFTLPLPIAASEWTETVAFEEDTRFEDKALTGDIESIYQQLNISRTNTSGVWSVADGRLTLKPYYTSNNSTDTAVTVPDSYTYKPVRGGYNSLSAVIGFKEDVGLVEKFSFQTNLGGAGHESLMVLTSYTSGAVYDGINVSGADKMRYFTRRLEGNTLTVTQYDGQYGYDLLPIYTDVDCTQTGSSITGDATVTVEFKIIEGSAYYFFTLTKGSENRYFKYPVSDMLTNIYFSVARKSSVSVSNLSYKVFGGFESGTELSKEEALVYQSIAAKHPAYFSRDDLEIIDKAINGSAGSEVTITFEDADAALFEDKAYTQDILDIYAAQNKTLSNSSNIWSISGGTLNIKPYVTGNNPDSFVAETDNYTYKNVTGGFNSLSAVIGLKEAPGPIDRFSFKTNLGGAAHQSLVVLTSFTNGAIYDGVAISGAPQMRYYTRVLDASTNTVTVTQYELGNGIQLYADADCTQPGTGLTGDVTVTAQYCLEDGASYYRFTLEKGEEKRYFKYSCQEMLTNIYFSVARHSGVKIDNLVYHVFSGLEGLDVTTLTYEEAVRYSQLAEKYPACFGEGEIEAINAQVQATLHLKLEAVIGEIPGVSTDDGTNAWVVNTQSKLRAAEKWFEKANRETLERVSNMQVYTDAKTYVTGKQNAANADFAYGAANRFELADISMLEAVDCLDKWNWGVAANPVSDAINGSGYVLEVTANSPAGAAEKKLGVYLLTKEHADGATGFIDTFRSKVLVTANTNPTLVYEYINDENWSGITFALTDSHGTGETRLTVAKVTATAGGIRREKVCYTVPLIGDAAELTGAQLWVDAMLRYDSTTLSLTVNTEKGLVRPYNLTFALSGSATARIGVAAFNDDAACYFDDIAYTLKYTDSFLQANAFRKTYGELLMLRGVTKADIDAAKLQEAISAYNSADSKVQYALSMVGVQLAELNAVAGSGAEISGMTVPGTYWENNTEYTVTDSFDDGKSLGKYTDIQTAQSVGYSLGRAPAVENGALHLEKTVLGIKSSLLPYKAQLKQIAFDAWIPEGTKVSADAPLRVYVYYHNDQNYAAIDFYTTDGYYDYRGEAYMVYQVVKNGSYDLKSSAACLLALDEPIHFNCDFNGNVITLSVTQNDEEQGQLYYSKVFTMAYLASKAAIGAHSGAFIDNYAVTYIQGDYDEDIVLEEIVPLYTGNTYIKPGETASFSGENLGNTVSSVKVFRISDGTGGARGYIDAQRWDFGGVASGTYSQDPVAVADIDWDGAIAAPIIQKTENSIKFVIPEELGEGIFAVRLSGETDTTVVYLNNPTLEYGVGDEGRQVTPGGQLQLVGKNLAPIEDAASGIRVVLVGNGYERELTISEIKSAYSLVVDIPADVTPGSTYEVWLYNGYGDSTCWSIPITVSVTEDIRASWGDAFINLKEYGATGEKTQNATPVFINALQELYEAGGGTLYLPRGIYRLEQPLIIPENVILTGQDMVETQIIWTPFQWAYGDLGTAVLKITNNVEISNISFYGSRISGFIEFYGTADGETGKSTSKNIYIENIRLEFNPYTGVVTNAATDEHRLLQPTELQNLVNAEAVTSLITRADEFAYTENVQLKNVNMLTTGNHQGIFLSHGTPSNSYYWQLQDVKVEAQWGTPALNYSVVEGFEADGAAQGLWGDCLYVDDSYFHDAFGNNRELVVADLAEHFSEANLTPVEDGGRNITFRVATTKNVNYLINGQVFVTAGNGIYQVRTIVDARKVSASTVELTLNSPFAVAVNRNSTVTVRVARNKIIYTDSRLYNGNAGFGFFGGYSDVIIDDNTIERVGRQYAYVNTQEDRGWYWSYVNNTNAYDPYFQQSMGNTDSDRFSNLYFFSKGTGAMHQHLVRNNDMGGYYLEFYTAGGNADCIVDFVIEGNRFTNLDNAVVYQDGADIAEAYNGFVIRKNINDSDTGLVDGKIKSAGGLLNTMGSKRVLISTDPLSSDVKGDADLDGSVTPKDMTYLQYYLVGKLELSDMQIANGDVDGDGYITVKDIIAIRSRLGL